MIAGVVVVIPLYCVAVLMSFLAARFGTTVVYGQSSGVYDHYFDTFLIPTDLLVVVRQAVAMAVVIMLVHTYYGYTASGGPAGVGEAVGRAVRTSLVVGGGRDRCWSRWPSTASPATSTCSDDDMEAKPGEGDLHPAWWTAISSIVGRSPRSC